MLHPLPAETVFEARRRARRNTWLLWSLLVFVYAGFFILMGLVTVFFLFPRQYVSSFHTTLFISGALGALVAVIQIVFFGDDNLQDFLKSLEAKEADARDQYHHVFINLVQEAQVATGIRRILPVLIDSLGNNAFSIEDGQGACAIGATEGLLTHLTRSELEAVVAHEAAHLAGGDSRLMTRASVFFKTFDAIHAACSSLRVRGRTAVLSIVLFLLSKIASFISRFLCMAISRQRELRADSHAVHMCRDPLSLAQALYKISKSYRGALTVPQSLQSNFTVHPSINRLDESSNFFSDLFSTHPPVEQRLTALIKWAKRDLNDAFEDVTLEKVNRTIEETPQPPELRYRVQLDGQWQGPWTKSQLLPLSQIVPITWISPEGTQDVMHAGDHPLLSMIFQERSKFGVGKNLCPRCRLGLISKSYEGAPILYCLSCGGYLLESGVLGRIIARRDKVFDKSQKENARTWRQMKLGKLISADLECSFPQILCPLCQSKMIKSRQTDLTAVIVERCLNGSCRAVWCDAGELETIQILIENPLLAKS